MSRMMNIYQQLQKIGSRGATAGEIGDTLQIDRSTASRYLNDLVKANRVEKIPGKPVKYVIKMPKRKGAANLNVIGAEESLQPLLETGMAAFLYPSRPLPILLTGETGTGKSYLAEKLSNMAIENSDTSGDVPFIAFNCADYAQNPELLVGQIFGIKQGAFTGATEDQTGLVEQANGGILFLDEIHRLPPSGQEMLFYLMDKGIYHRLGEATQERRANIALIGATTKESETYILSTLLRRFSVKLDVPPLRDRTDAERKALIDHFLTEEASKMNTGLSIGNDCRQAFLSYDCPGNIGQLKSDIQIACARAYLRYLNKEEAKVLVKLEDFPGENRVKSKGGSHTYRNIEVNHETDEPSYLFPNIYQRLDYKSRDTQNKDKRNLQQVVLDYIRDLTEKYQQPSFSRDSWQQLIDHDLFQVLQNTVDILNANLPFNIDKNRVYVIGLHLQNYRNHLRENIQKEPIPVMIHPNAMYRQAAGQLAFQLRTEIDMDLPQEEIELLAHFLTPEKQTEQEMTSEQELAVILVTHGTSTASSMAEVTNYLLGNHVIHAVDMPLNMSAEDTYERVKKTINGMSQIRGVLLLVDIGSLITMGDTIQHELNVSIKTLSSVNLPMVLEAGRQSLISEQTLDGMYQEAKSALLTFMEKDQQQASIQKKRLIATVCFTGEGAAQLLESWLENQLSTVDQDVLIRSVRIDPVTKDTSVLTDLKDYYDVIAIIGTVPVSIEGIPYIPAWELLQVEGISRMQKLLEITRKSSVLQLDEHVSEDEIYDLIIQGLQEIVTYINPKTMAELLQEHIPPIRDYYGWDSNRELGMWMHIGSLIDRILDTTLKNQDDQFLSSIPLDHQTVPSSQEVEIWRPLFDHIYQTFHIELIDDIKREIVKLSR
ncbi:Transcriptional regulator containing an AAA-type ATPase domain and a DNA-binding domain [Lentibacillus halodurans]|uniref:Transcriptional regulator containing an AAA-type ATPase domain and a DNA-binding domain n=1 Tax=Lentibacillus halodurans TaxID=237679 RepID=A0A1I1A4P9_9BACI|nr:sigma 54-interacting transcriptional regulator [Lentibacillus halodurans]SFB32915.1 Transcriptional regulator containing an AAA-type ATPase domain and a DNA-binding domain [Lentibacillus halodurans]